MSQPTLYQDWQTRHGRLVQHGAPTWRHLDFQRPVLEFLIKRYAGDAVAQKPALFPLPSPLILQRRTMIVQHHLAKNLNWHIHDENDARKKTSTILERMKARNARESVGTPASGSFGADFFSGIGWGNTGQSLRLNVWEDEMLSLFEAMNEADKLRQLNGAYNVLIHEKNANIRKIALARLLLSRISQPKALDYVVLLWQDKFNTESLIVTELSWFDKVFEMTSQRGHLLSHMRNALDVSNPNVRFAALKWLEKLGTLDDIGLLADLHALPPEAIPDETERNRLAQAMQKLSGLEKA